MKNAFTCVLVFARFGNVSSVAKAVQTRLLRLTKSVCSVFFRALSIKKVASAKPALSQKFTSAVTQLGHKTAVEFRKVVPVRINQHILVYLVFARER